MEARVILANAPAKTTALAGVFEVHAQRFSVSDSVALALGSNDGVGRECRYEEAEDVVLAKNECCHFETPLQKVRAGGCRSVCCYLVVVLIYKTNKVLYTKSGVFVYTS